MLSTRRISPPNPHPESQGASDATTKSRRRTKIHEEEFFFVLSWIFVFSWLFLCAETSRPVFRGASPAPNPESRIQIPNLKVPRMPPRSHEDVRRYTKKNILFRAFVDLRV